MTPNIYRNYWVGDFFVCSVMPQEHESYLLNRSAIFSLSTGAENRTDLSLTPNPAVNYSAIVGGVFVGTSPILDALVKILTQSGDPIDHQYTSEEGTYSSSQLPAGIYQVVASAPGFLTSVPVTVNLPANSAAFQDFTLIPDPRVLLNTAFGLILDQSTGNRITDAVVILTISDGTTVSTTTSNSDGQYLIYGINNGSYFITAQKTGYVLPIPIPLTLTGSMLAKTNITLTPEVVSPGTVQGFIRSVSDLPLSGACVGLYLVSGTSETLVQSTFTTGNGFYLFGGVAAGNYLVKAKVDILV